MKITFGIEDGYVGNRPHTVEVPDSELAECETSEERVVLIDQAIEDWKEQHLHSFWQQDQLSKWEQENAELIQRTQEENKVD